MSQLTPRQETHEHIKQVRIRLDYLIDMLVERGLNHDKSKLEEPEASIFERETPKLRGLTYGSPEYIEGVKKLGVALEHHYANNRHHPEFFKGKRECNGCFKRFPSDWESPCDVCGYTQSTVRFDLLEMNLLDIIEMLVDWDAASMRHANGDIFKSIEINQQRFNYTDETKAILINTAKLLKGMPR